MNVLILEDEPATARDLIQTLGKVVDTLTIVAVLDTVKESIDLLSQKPEIDLIISDVRLADGLCFKIFQTVEITCPVLFCTAYSEYAIDAFKSNGIGYILKPFSELDLRENLKKLQNFRTYFTTDSRFWNDLMEGRSESGRSYPSSFLIFHMDKWMPVSLKDISFFHLKTGIVYLQTCDEKRYSLPKTLKEIEKQLNPAQFFRANRQYIINRKIVAEVSKLHPRKLKVKLNIPEPDTIIVSKAKSSEFLDWLNS